MSGFSIQRAALEGQPGLVRSLLSENPNLINAKDDDGRTALHWASTRDNLGMIQLLLGYQPDLEAKDKMGWTSLMIACESITFSV
ncbi:ankyrin repeat-containing domain protein [Naematelia encephala]|uniref:Ankyrin repeat-containing domain protein n=1 Tax=Naematelia encephala TaxID=71784 RepID=A0A1Y2ASJ4_9TREE|nr:ankyrin repeat-containing domain protein [Naematelia encephala]